MKSTINIKGEMYFQKRKKQLQKLLYTFPVFNSVITFLFILGSKSKSHLYFSMFLSLALASFILFIIVSFFQKINRTVNEVTIDENTIELKTFKIFFLKSRNFKINRNQMKLVPEKNHINKKEIEEGWKIRTVNKSYYIFILKNFFDEEVIEQLKRF